MRPLVLAVALYSFSHKRERRDLKAKGSLWMRTHGAYQQRGLWGGAPPPEGRLSWPNGSDPRARVCKVTQAGWSLCCPEIIWTGLELVSTTQITGKQDIFTENANKSRTWKVMFLYILYTIIIFCRPQGEKKDIMEAKISVKSEQISYPAFSPHY